MSTPEPRASCGELHIWPAVAWAHPRAEQGRLCQERGAAKKGCRLSPDKSWEVTQSWILRAAGRSLHDCCAGSRLWPHAAPSARSSLPWEARRAAQQAFSSQPGEQAGPGAASASWSRCQPARPWALRGDQRGTVKHVDPNVLTLVTESRLKTTQNLLTTEPPLSSGCLLPNFSDNCGLCANASGDSRAACLAASKP